MIINEESDKENQLISIYWLKNPHTHIFVCIYIKGRGKNYSATDKASRLLKRKYGATL